MAKKKKLRKGATKTVKGKTYKLNKSSRWESMRKSGLGLTVAGASAYGIGQLGAHTYAKAIQAAADTRYVSDVLTFKANHGGPGGRGLIARRPHPKKARILRTARYYGTKSVRMDKLHPIARRVGNVGVRAGLVGLAVGIPLLVVGVSKSRKRSRKRS